MIDEELKCVPNWKRTLNRMERHEFGQSLVIAGLMCGSIILSGLFAGTIDPAADAVQMVDPVMPFVDLGLGFYALAAQGFAMMRHADRPWKG